MKGTLTQSRHRRKPRAHSPTAALEARAARALIEATLDAHGWPWRRRLSRWVDALVVLENHEGA
jgi:hypothetical protein